MKREFHKGKHKTLTRYEETLNCTCSQRSNEAFFTPICMTDESVMMGSVCEAMGQMETSWTDGTVN